MNGLYGNMLSYFQPMFKDLNYFDMKPLVNGSFDITKDRDGQTIVPVVIRGCIQNLNANTTKDANGNLILVQSGTLWSNTELSLGKFIQETDLTVFRLVRFNGWSAEGGFYKYECEQVVGDDGRLTVEPDFEMGEGAFF